MKRGFISAITALMLVGTTAVAQEIAKTNKSISNQAIVNTTQNLTKQKNSIKVVQEAVDAVALSQQVLVELNENQKDKAIKTLEKAIGKLEVVMSAPNAPALIPIAARVEASEFLGTPYDVENAVITSTALLRSRHIQEARVIVEKLKDEIDLITVNLPLASYPAALKLAAKYLHEDKIDKAKVVIANALHTFVEVDVITPIGIIQAQQFVQEASKIAKSDKKRAMEYLQAAKMALKKSEALGYTSRSDTTYKMLQDAISNITKEIKGKNESTKLFEELIEKLKEFKDKAIGSITK